MVELPAAETIAESFGCATSTLRGYLAELRSAGWVATKRATKAHGTLYSVMEDVVSSSDIQRHQNRDFSGSRARGPFSLSSKEASTTYSSGLALEKQVPPLTMVEGRNLAFDALQIACFIANTSPRRRQLAPALNGDGRRPDEPGIRAQFWCEVVAKYQGEVPSHAPEQFEQALAAAIATRSRLYRFVHGDGVTLTPLALRKWWSDLPALAREKQAGGSDLATRLLRDADRLREEGK